AAFEAYSAILAHELASTGVTVNVLVPGGPVDTAMLPPTPGLARESLLKTDVMAAPLLWLASTASDGVTLRRFRANLWDEALSAADAAELSGSPIAWLGLASGQMRKPAATSQASQPA
ncbi:MAG: hypothetical protein Q7U62_09975, partial [Burkholderiaceae bacterium]|nr:hypothetical protein [Burkholderiaceae bacterium]